MSKFVISQNHPLIPRQQNYVLTRKIISIHSYDRDIAKWPNANHFEIELPSALTNIQSMRLVQISLPNSQYVFSNSYQNIKLQFTLLSGIPGTYTITIDEGSYTADELTIEIATKMNKAVSPTYTGFVCKYNSVSNTFWFGNTVDNFTLDFGVNPGYTIPCGQKEVWTHYTKWGLPAYLGYQKKTYTAVEDTSGVTDPSGFGFDYEYPTLWLDSSGNDPVYYVDASKNCHLDIFGEETIYMDVKKRNSIDELEPYSENTMSLYNNDYAGKVDSAFAKIPIVNAEKFASYSDSRNFFLMNLSQFTPPIDRIMRLEFTFRFHDGRLVDFKCMPFNFSLEFNMLRDDPQRNMTIRNPVIFGL